MSEQITRPGGGRAVRLVLVSMGLIVAGIVLLLLFMPEAGFSYDRYRGMERRTSRFSGVSELLSPVGWVPLANSLPGEGTGAGTQPLSAGDLESLRVVGLPSVDQGTLMVTASNRTRYTLRNIKVAYCSRLPVKGDSQEADDWIRTVSSGGTAEGMGADAEILMAVLGSSPEKRATLAGMAWVFREERRGRRSELYWSLEEAAIQLKPGAVAVVEMSSVAARGDPVDHTGMPIRAVRILGASGRP